MCAFLCAFWPKYVRVCALFENFWCAHFCALFGWILCAFEFRIIRHSGIFSFCFTALSATWNCHKLIFEVNFETSCMKTLENCEPKLGHGRRVGSSEQSADCSDKPCVWFVLTKNFRTSNLFRTFFKPFCNHFFNLFKMFIQ